MPAKQFTVGMTLIIPAGIALSFAPTFWYVALVVGGLLVLVAAVGEYLKRTAPERPDRVALLRGQYELGQRLQERLVVMGGEAETPEQVEKADRRARDATCEWAKGAWRTIRDYFPSAEREFYGPGTRSFGDWGFALSCREELDQTFHGLPDNYLEAKLTLIAGLLDKYDEGSRV